MKRILITLTVAALVAITLCSCEKKEVKAPAKGEVKKGLTQPRTITKDQLAGMECLMKKGIRRKVLIKRDGVVCRKEPGGEFNGKTAKFYEPYFLFGVYPKGAEGDNIEYYQIGPEPRKSSIIGWVSSVDAVSWDTRVGASYIGRPLLVFGTKKDIEEYVKTGNPQKAIARTRLETKFKPMSWPITNFEDFEHNGKVCQLYEINFLGEFTKGSHLTETPVSIGSGKGSVLTKKQIELRETIRRLDVVFVIDTTNSMEPYIEAVKQTVKNLVVGIKNLPSNPDVEFRMVEYRDYVKGLMWGKEVTREHPSGGGFVKSSEFLKLIDPVHDGVVSSVEHPEAMYEGVYTGIMRTNWRGKLSHRIIVLIGDDPSHLPGHSKNPNNYSGKYILSLANERVIKIFSLLAPCRGNEKFRRLQREQFTELAKGTGSECYLLNEAKNIIQKVDDIMKSEAGVIKGRLVGMKEYARIAADLGEMPKREDIERRIDVRDKTVVMEFLGFIQKRGATLEMIGIDIPTFSKGWIVSETGGMPLVERNIYIAKKELGFLSSELEMITILLESGEEATGFQRIYDDSGVMRAEGMILSRLSAVSQERPGTISAWHGSLGVPGSGLFKMTKDELIHMPQSKKDALRYRLEREFKPKIVNDLNNDDIFGFYGTGVKFGWVPEDHIP